MTLRFIRRCGMEEIENPSKKLEIINDKSWKRETALGGIIFWSCITVKMFWFAAVDQINALSPLYTVVTSTIWLFAGAVFGLHYALTKMYPIKGETSS